jgi:hypothetical protein
MINPKNIQVYYKLFTFLKILYKAVHNMPKEYKFNIGQESIALSWSCLDLILNANSKDRESKKDQLKKLSLEFDKLKLRLRMMQEMKIITIAQFSNWQENYINSIGAMIGGWLKWNK